MQNRFLVLVSFYPVKLFVFVFHTFTMISHWFMQEGLAMIDDGHRDGKRRYWFPCVAPISVAVDLMA